MEFFKLLMHEIFKRAVDENIFVVELRHTLGTIFDQERKAIPIEEELKIIEEMVDHYKADYPYF